MHLIINIGLNIYLKPILYLRYCFLKLILNLLLAFSVTVYSSLIQNLFSH